MSSPLENNRRMWDRWAELHIESRSYDVEGFLAGKSQLDPLVLELLGDVAGKRLLHLQCHIGLDTLNLARRGAIVTGADFSGAAIAAARDLTERAGLDATFVQSPVSDLPNRLDGEFDVVFSSWGILPWLDDLRRWAEVIAHFLVPGGRLAVAEDHPFAWIFDDERGDAELVPVQSYVDDGPTLWPGTGTYAEPDAPVDSDHYEWMHTISGILDAVRAAGLRVESFREHTFGAWQLLPFLVESPDGFWRMPEGRPALPLSFTLEAVRPRN